MIGCSWFPHAGSLSVIYCSWFPHAGSLSVIDCSWFPHAGPKPVDVKTHPLPWISEHHPQVQAGGTWRPDCKPKQKVAVLVPYRDRHEDLLLLLNNIHPFMQAQLLEYTVYLVEQVMSPYNSRVAQGTYLEVEYIRDVLSVSGTLKYADSGTT